MALTKTRNELGEEALSQLGVLSAGQSPAAEDTAKVLGKLEATLADLAQREVIYVPYSDAVPIALFTDLGTCLAEACETDFGLVAGALRDKRLVAESNLQRKGRAPRSYEVVTGGFF